jgi:hypothetical protein
MLVFAAVTATFILSKTNDEAVQLRASLRLGTVP